MAALARVTYSVVQSARPRFDFETLVFPRVETYPSPENGNILLIACAFCFLLKLPFVSTHICACSLVISQARMVFLGLRIIIHIKSP